VAAHHQAYAVEALHPLGQPFYPAMGETQDRVIQVNPLGEHQDLHFLRLPLKQRLLLKQFFNQPPSHK
jgi:hypothetical protein